MSHNRKLIFTVVTSDYFIISFFLKLKCKYNFPLKSELLQKYYRNIIIQISLFCYLKYGKVGKKWYELNPFSHNDILNTKLRENKQLGKIRKLLHTVHHNLVKFLLPKHKIFRFSICYTFCCKTACFLVLHAISLIICIRKDKGVKGLQ